MIVKYKNFSIDVRAIDEYDISEHARKHDKYYPTDLGVVLEYKPSSIHVIQVSENGMEKCSALLAECGGATGISNNSFILKDERIFICCSNTVYSLNLIDLSINWRKEFDDVTCFGIHEFEDDFIIHGELSVSRIDHKGNIKWNYCPRDILVNLDGKEVFKIIDNYIELIDFQGYKYILSKDGEVLSSINIFMRQLKIIMNKFFFGGRRDASPYS
jgi:hypothetical protein